MKKEVLEKLIREKHSTRSIAKITQKGHTTIRYWLDKYNLKTNPYKPIEKCQFCGENLHRKNKKYCNVKCQQNFQWEQRKNIIEKSGEIEGVVSGKRYLKETRGEKCEICGVKEWNCKDLTMIMDHIDGDSSNNSLLNLRLICPNCDSQLPTYKSRNRGNGRHSRRKRYAEEKFGTR